MRFLLDENLSPVLAELLAAVGHDAVHVRDIGLPRSPDRDVLDRARSDKRVLISADTDFGELLALSGEALPSVILVRRQSGRSAVTQAGVLLANVDQVATDLEAGAIVVLDATRVRVRRLPVGSAE